MGLQLDDLFEPNSTPKLTLSKLPYCKPREPPRHMQTPPLRPSVSIPFHWEEAPGKPRATVAEAAASPPSYKVVRCLDLPPRLLHDDSSENKIMPSPTTVLGGPYVGRSLSLACTFSFRKGPAPAREEGLRPAKRSGAGKFGSGRWGSFTEEGRDSFDISQSLGDIFKSEDNVKMRRVRRRMSFFSFSTIKSNMWGEIYARFKQVVPWRCNHEI